MPRKIQRTRKRLRDAQDQARGEYFLSPSNSYSFIHSGAAPLDCVLGGGWPLARVSNIVGDKSTGKTLLAIEAMTNFILQFPRNKVRFAETEQAFDDAYAEALGIPLKRLIRPKEPIETVEAFYEDLKWYLDEYKEGGLYVLDSLDALSDAAEMDRDISKDSYGTSKAAKMSQMFRRIMSGLEESKCHLMIISQVRDNIGVSFGRRYKRSGGRALDFYASQIIYLAHLGEIKQTRGGLKRSIGINVRIKCTKNKIGLPFRSCDLPVMFGYGIEDVASCIDWLIENKQTKRTGLSLADLKAIRKDALHSELDDIEELRVELAQHVENGWREVERSFLPTRRKYH